MEGGNSLQLLLTSPSNSVPSSYADLFFSTNFHALLENNYPMLPPSTIPCRQLFHELVIRPNRSINQPRLHRRSNIIATLTPNQKLPLLFSFGTLQSSALPSKPKPYLRPARPDPPSSCPYRIRHFNTSIQSPSSLSSLPN